MLPFRPKLRGAALFTWVIGFAALVVALISWLVAFDQHSTPILALAGIGLALTGVARAMNRRSPTSSSR